MGTDTAISTDPNRGQPKEKAAGPACAAARRGRSAVGMSGGKSPAYEDWPDAELHNRAEELDLHGSSKRNETNLLGKIRNHGRPTR
ncbi:Rho termination factor [Rhodococcus sp. T2V]|uniref:Rho termination factor n=1 Tax=Rhodococcus sp. T2V TaxID=3034164 RepID=UPI0023E1CDF4|nr:Rho termination factor [Rhodococcus sp. T2V]MDF3311998.1 Rho termination factor [Rhodococcus sp. T2V]